jgi:serine/threonine-protein kinase
MGQPSGPASDLYSLCVVGYYLVTGARIFDHESAVAFLDAHRSQAPVPPSRRNAAVPKDLEAVILKGLEKAPQDRWPNAFALRQALRGCRDATGWTQERAAEWWTTHAASQGVVAAQEG